VNIYNLWCVYFHYNVVPPSTDTVLEQSDECTGESVNINNDNVLLPAFRETHRLQMRDSCSASRWHYGAYHDLWPAT